MSGEENLLDVHPFGSRLRESIRWFLIDGADLASHLESGDGRGALYVGRRVDQAWRRIEHIALNWLDADNVDGDEDEDLTRVLRETARLRSVPNHDEPADRWVACARDAFQAAGDAAPALEPSRSSVMVQTRVAREAYSLYRVAKYRWIAMSLDRDDQAGVAYEVLES